MPQYRAYRIKGNKIDIAATIITADTDADAIEQTGRLVDGHDMELWHDSRFVSGFKSKDTK
jgi:hypothetical protein